jgi:hypothetical protein
MSVKPHPMSSKLCTHAWQAQTYSTHLDHLDSATPVIDTKQPNTFNYIINRKKFITMEEEKCQQIDKNNAILLKVIDIQIHISSI